MYVCTYENVFERVYVKGGGGERVEDPTSNGPSKCLSSRSFSIFGRSPNFSKNSEPSLNLRGTREKKIEQGGGRISLKDLLDGERRTGPSTSNFLIISEIRIRN